MGTRADFYIGRGESAEWIGSIAWDGYPDGITPCNGKVGPFGAKEHEAWPVGQHLFNASTPEEFRSRVMRFFEHRDDVTLPSQGWPWPWDDSLTTDYSYAFDDGIVYATNWGYQWWPALNAEPDDDRDYQRKVAVFPNMKARQNVTMGKRSGVIVVGS